MPHHRTTEIMRRILVQPDPGSRISGGYLYNQRMAEHAPASRPLALASVPTARAVDIVGALDSLALAAGDLVLADSLFLHPDRLAPFTALRARGVRVGMLLHALPSFVERAAAGQASQRATDVERDLLAQIDFLIVPGPYLEAVLAGVGPVHVCSPGIDDAWRRSAPPGSTSGHDPGRDVNVPAVLSAGAVTPVKGFDDLADALASLLPGRQLVWNIAGSTEVDPDHVAHLRGHLARAGLGGIARLLGQRPVDEVRALFAASDLVAMASHSENHPLVAMEALAACVPTVGYDVGGMSAIVDHGETGLLARHRDVADLARQLRLLLDDPGLRHRMAMTCWERRDLLLSWPRAASALADALGREGG
jgi:glycosyltransferase involved in cell wall biosynthesis